MPRCLDRVVETPPRVRVASRATVRGPRDVVDHGSSIFRTNETATGGYARRRARASSTCAASSSATCIHCSSAGTTREMTRASCHVTSATGAQRVRPRAAYTGFRRVLRADGHAPPAEGCAEGSTRAPLRRASNRDPRVPTRRRPLHPRVVSGLQRRRISSGSRPPYSN